MVRDLDDADMGAAYLRQAAAATELTSEQEAELLRQLGVIDWDERREEIARGLIESRLRLVVAIAKKHSSSGRLSMRERLEEGNLGLMQAVRSYASNPSGEFAAFAAACIENAINGAEKYRDFGDERITTARE